MDSERLILHVVPTYEEHLNDKRCWCKPRVDICKCVDHRKSTIWIHNSSTYGRLFAG